MYLSNENLEKTDSKDLINLFSTAEHLYEGIELFMRACYEACVKIIVESVGESVISVFNKHNNKWRTIGEENVNDELFVALNGPELGEADKVLQESLDLHFSKSQHGWHFTTNNLFKTSGLTIDILLTIKKKLISIKSAFSNSKVFYTANPSIYTCLFHLRINFMLLLFVLMTNK